MEERFDLHMHSCFSDGKDLPEAMVQSAIAKGLTTVGLSDHSYMSFDDYGLAWERYEEYRREMDRLKALYGDRIRVLCGLEQDYYSPEPSIPLDYRIGSVHSVAVPGGMLSVDDSYEIQMAGVEKYFGGDWLAFAEAYYALVGDVAEATGCQIVGHFDLLTKFAERHPRKELQDSRYKAAWQAAADKLLQKNVVFEENYGAISRGYRTTPYPAPEIRAYLEERGARFISTSDAHAAGDVASFLLKKPKI